MKQTSKESREYKETETRVFQKFQPYAASKSIFMFGLLIFTCDWQHTDEKGRTTDKTPPAASSQQQQQHKREGNDNKRCENSNNNNKSNNEKRQTETVANNKWVKFMKKQFLAAGHKNISTSNSSNNNRGAPCSQWGGWKHRAAGGRN